MPNHQGVIHMKRLAAAGLLAGTMLAAPAYALTFVPGDIVVSVEGNGVWGATNVTTYGDNQAAPLTLMEFTPTGTYVGSEVLPQSSSGVAQTISGEYGSSSEGSLQLSGNREYLTIMGYGVNAATFNSNPQNYGPAANTALAQSYSADVPRVVALINASGGVNSTTALTNVFSGNNPRSVYTANGTSFYVSGQGTSGDSTGGVFYATLGSHTATSITGNDAGTGESQDARFVTVYDGQLYVSVDSKAGATNRDYIGTLGSQGSLPTSVANGGNGPTMLAGFGNNGGTGRVTITKGDTNGINAKGDVVNLSPEEYFFANATTLYVTDSGDPKNTSEQNVTGGSPLGDGGLQKWSLVSGTWELDYTLAAGLDLVPNTDSSGTTGLLGLTGEVVGNEVYLYATNYTLGDLDQTYLYEITDTLNATTKPSGESFTELAAAPSDSNFKGVSFAPIGFGAVPEPGTWALMLGGLGLVGGMARRRRQAIAA
jgi:PEP-CTERM motif